MRQIVGQNVSWIQIVLQRWPAYVINAKVHAMEHVDRMHIARCSIIRHIVFVMKGSREIRLLVVVVLFYVSLNFVNFS